MTEPVEDHAGLVEDHAALLQRGVPLIDVRAPAEFERGAFDQAVNLPLLDDTERRAVGIEYKQLGQGAAIALGESLVSGARRSERIDKWLHFVALHPDAALYCWRGGLRSRVVQHWLNEAGAHVPRVSGGFKALRTTCTNTLDAAAERAFLILGGRTGSGKTRLLRTLSCGIDLEELANHRGSAFGGDLAAQPSPIHFENRLAISLLCLPATRRVLLEDESRTIGRLALPEKMYHAMQSAPLVVLESPLSERTEHILDEYVMLPLSNGIPGSTLRDRYVDALHRIGKRLGGLRHLELVGAVESAFAAREPDAHRHWIGRLLSTYYDPMYDYQMSRKSARVVFRGEATAVREYLERESTPTG